MDNFYILIIIIFLALNSKKIVKSLGNINMKLIKNNNNKVKYIVILVIIALLLYFTMMNKKDEFSEQEEEEGGIWTDLYNTLPDVGYNDYMEGSVTEPVEHEHPAGADYKHKHGNTTEPSTIRHSHIIESPTMTPEPEL